jgi:hypothetical protein
MAKRNNEKPRRPKKHIDKKLQALYEKSRQEFTAADLQKFTVVEKGIPLEKVIAEMEAIQNNQNSKKA